MSLATVENKAATIDDKMKMLGFSNDTIDRLVKDPEFENKIPYFIRKFTKTLVHGKSKDFDESQVILVCGPERSGKTVLSEKLEKFLSTNLDGLPTTVIADPLAGDLASIFKSGVDSNITSLFRKRPGANINSGRLVIDYEGSMEVLSSVLLKLGELEQRPNVSVVYALEVGKSYTAVKNLLEKVDIPNLYIALTKMDLLEVSVSELSAISDLKNKILFFSGLKAVADGLDFAKVSVMENFLTNLAKQEGW
jgi:predicted Ser/Thr protein kinase